MSSEITTAFVKQFSLGMNHKLGRVLFTIELAQLLRKKEHRVTRILHKWTLRTVEDALL